MDVSVVHFLGRRSNLNEGNFTWFNFLDVSVVEFYIEVHVNQGLLSNY